MIVLLKMPSKYREFFPNLFLKTTDFQLDFNFEQMRRVTILFWRARHNGSDTIKLWLSQSEL